MNENDPEIKELNRKIKLLKGWIWAVDWDGDGDPGLLTSLGKAKDEMQKELDDLETTLMCLMSD